MVLVSNWILQRIEVNVEYLDKLHKAVNTRQGTFWNSCVFYFIRSAKGKTNYLKKYKCQNKTKQNRQKKKLWHIFSKEQSEYSFLKKLMFSSETIVNPMDMKEAHNIMPWLFDFGMQCGHPLLALQRKLTHVSKLLNRENFIRHQENG